MKCVICKEAETKSGKTSLVFERNGSTIVFKDVPARVCSNCGEAYVADEVTGNILKTVESELKKGVELEIIQYAA